MYLRTSPTHSHCKCTYYKVLHTLHLSESSHLTNTLTLSTHTAPQCIFSQRLTQSTHTTPQCIFSPHQHTDTVNTHCTTVYLLTSLTHLYCPHSQHSLYRSVFSLFTKTLTQPAPSHSHCTTVCPVTSATH